MNKRTIGTKYELIACEYLKSQGYKILEKNFRCRSGEIDIIAEDEKYLVFIEVKYRSGNSCGYAASAVSFRKQQVISRTARFYLMKNNIPDTCPCRFDVVAIDQKEIHLYKNAFDYCG